MTPLQQPGTVSFRPRGRFRVPWAHLAIGLSLFAGAAVATAGALVLAGHGRELGLTLAAARGMDVLALGTLVGTGPAAYAGWAHRRRLHQLDSRLPDLLADLASLHKAGLTLQESLTTAARGSYGTLDREARFAADQVRWNIPILQVLENLRRRIGTPIAHRTLTVVIEAARGGGNVPEVLEIAAGNARAFVQMRDQRARTMGMYILVTYVASFIFIGVSLAMNTVFVPRMIEAFQRTAGAGLGLAAGVPDLSDFRNLFYSAALVQAMGNGLVGGIMADGRMISGLRHSWAMTLACFLGFLWAG